MTRAWARRVLALVAAVGALAAGCTGGDGGDTTAAGDPGDCVVVDLAVSSEKIDLLRDLATTFNGSDDATVDGRCVFARPQQKASGAAMSLLAEGWPDEEVDGPRPVVWSPASSAWGAIVNQLLDERGEAPMAAGGRPIMRTPLVIAMPEPMARALGWPDEPLGWADVLALARNPEGWAAFGHPEWGPFRLGKTNPNFSTSGLSATVATYYAATGKVRDLTLEDLRAEGVQEFARGVESAVVHYGDITMTFLNNWFRNDARGSALTYASAVAVEEKSIIDYNRGNPDGILDPGEVPREPRVPLVAVYPEEGTLFSDNPYIVLDAPWVTEQEKAAAAVFERFVRQPANQRRVLEFGFRPGNVEVGVADPIVPANGVDPDQPQTSLEVPEPPVLVEALRQWGEQRKSARVLLVLDVSGSMGDPAGDGDTKLDLAVRAAVDALGQFKGHDEVGLWAFSTGLGPDGTADWLELVPPGAVAEQRETLASALRAQFPQNGTPLYSVATAAHDAMLEAYDPAKINAVVLLTDGRNEDPRNDDLQGMLARLRAHNEGRSTRPVRVFPIAYGDDADLATLRRIAEATDAAVYDAADPRTIEEVFTAVVSNF